MVPAALPHWDWRAWLYALLSLSMVRMAPVALSLARSGLRPAKALPYRCSWNRQWSSRSC